jgi:GNAT superfamily N-acetyltransferase
MNIDIRAARSEDASHACDLLRQSIVQCCAEDHRDDKTVLTAWLGNKTPETVQVWFASPSNHSLIALVDGRIAGVAILTRKGKLGLLHVSPDLRFSGVGKTLLGAMESQAKAWGLNNLQVNSTRTAQNFYLRNGYLDVAIVSAAYGIDAILLSKRLAASYACKPACRCSLVIE